jgi:hypothetical protein
MLVKYNACRDWSAALLKAMPPRKGFVLKPSSTRGGNDPSGNAAPELMPGAEEEAAHDVAASRSDAENATTSGDSESESEDED